MPAAGTLTLQPIGRLHSPYREKFAVPRQPGLVSHAHARLELLPPFNDPQTLRGIEQYSHLWLIFQFHHCAEQGWHPTVRPPRLGGNERMGVFATRSPFRPNGLGLSVVRLEGWQQQGAAVWLDLSGVDLVDGTPILDIKPYVPFADSLPTAVSQFALSAHERGEHGGLAARRGAGIEYALAGLRRQQQRGNSGGRILREEPALAVAGQARESGPARDDEAGFRIG